MNQEVHDQFIDANGIKISYRAFGEGLSPIIFVHGFPFNKHMWQHQADFLGKSYHVITYDIRGFGKSTSQNFRPVSIDLFSEDLLALMDSLHIEKAVVCGFSMGGYIVMNAVKRFPDRFSALILADTQSIGDSPDMKENRQDAIVEISSFGLKSFAENFTKKLFSRASLKHNLQLVKTVKQSILATSPEAIIATLDALANREPLCDSLHRIDVPTLIICGSEDQLTPIEQSVYLQQNIPNALIEVVNKAGHLANLEQPEKFNKIIYNFIENLPHLSTIKLYGNENLIIEPSMGNEYLKD